MANVEIKPYGCLCELEKFYINGIRAEWEDFGDKYDTNRFDADPYGCGDMRFIPFDNPSEEVLAKYNITVMEWENICDKLEDALSFGHCGWCI